MTEQGQGKCGRGDKGIWDGDTEQVLGSGQGVDVGVRELWGVLVPEEV